MGVFFHRTYRNTRFLCLIVCICLAGFIWYKAREISQELRSSTSAIEFISKSGSVSFGIEILNRLAPATTRKHIYLAYIGSHFYDETRKKEKRLPDVIGIGTEKCGMKRLQWMLAHHPMIVPSNPSELLFFGTEREEKGGDYYKDLMPEVTNYELASEYTSAYFSFGPRHLPMSVKKTAPNAKLILILCDPVSRTYSDFNHKKKTGSLTSDVSFETFWTELQAKFSEMPKNSDSAATDFIYKITDERAHILSTGLYYYHLLRWFEVYDRKEIHIINGDDLASDPGSVIKKVQRFLKIPALIIKEDFVREQSGSYCMSFPRPIFTDADIKLERPSSPECIPLHSKEGARMGLDSPSKAVIESLRSFFAPHNKKLYKLIGKNFDWQ